MAFPFTSLVDFGSECVTAGWSGSFASSRADWLRPVNVLPFLSRITVSAKKPVGSMKRFGRFSTYANGSRLPSSPIGSALMYLPISGS
jgi:hypothetical protein